MASKNVIPEHILPQNITARLNSDTPDLKIGDLVKIWRGGYTDDLWANRIGMVTKIIKCPLYRDTGRLCAMRWEYEVLWSNAPTDEEYEEAGLANRKNRDYDPGTKIGTHPQSDLRFADHDLNVIFVALMEDYYHINNLKYRSEKVDRSKFKELPIPKHLLKQLISY